MEQRVTPDVFCGSAVAALCGILMGLWLHGSWQKHPGGPHIWSASPAAEALVQPAKDDRQVAEAEPGPETQPVADFDTGYVTPAPLPVTRLDPERFDPKPAAAAAQREDVGDELAQAASTPGPDLD